MEHAPELIISSKPADLKSDIWALGAVILEILLDKKLWDIGALRKGADQTNTFDVLRYFDLISFERIEGVLDYPLNLYSMGLWFVSYFSSRHSVPTLHMSINISS